MNISTKIQYDNILSVFKCLREFEKCNIPVEYIDTNSVMGEKAVIIGEKLKQEIKTDTDRLYLKYLNEQNEYCEKMKGKESSQDICKRFNDELYYKLFQMPIDKKTQKAIKRKQLDKSIYAPDENMISNYKNPDYNFLKKKNNVIKLGLGLIKKGEHKKALKKYSYKFISKRSADICYKEESKEEYEMDSY